MLPESIWLTANNHVTNMEIISIKPCSQKYLFHGAGEYYEVLDPKHNRPHNWVYEYGIPVVFAWVQPSSKFCYQFTDGYLEAKKQYWWAFHRILVWERNILLWGIFGWYVYVLDGTQFYEVMRKDYKVWKWITSTEYIATSTQTPIAVVKVDKPIDWESIEPYEYLWAENVGGLQYDDFKNICLDQNRPELLKAVDDYLLKPFEAYIPRELEKYMS
jgi:hypothetical protein